MRWSNITIFLLPLLISTSSAAWSWTEKTEDTKTNNEQTELLQGEALPEAQEKSIESTNDTVLDDIVDELISSKQGRSLGGFDDVYSDPTIKEALDSGDDSEARNLIKERLCSLGLMQCEGESIQEKRPYVSPDELIYAQPVDIKPIGKPVASIAVRGPPRAYGSPKPMPYPSRPHKLPPKRIGYGGNVRPGFSDKYGQVSSGNFQFSQSNGLYSGSSDTGYLSKPPPGYANESPYAFDNIKQGVYNKPAPISLIQSTTKTESVVQQHVHHHYVHGDGDKDPKVIIKPVAIPVGSVGSLVQQSQSQHATDIITAGGADFSSLSTGGFKPMTGNLYLSDKYTDYAGQRCWTTGWGKDAFGDYGKYQNILKEVDVPILGHSQCQQQRKVKSQKSVIEASDNPNTFVLPDSLPCFVFYKRNRRIPKCTYCASSNASSFSLRLSLKYRHDEDYDK